jgi:nucleotide-binding universal stress UspA family protein
MVTRIVVPLDGSETAELALTRAIELGQHHQAPLHLVQVVDLSARHSYYSYLSTERSGLNRELEAEESEASAYLEMIRRHLLNEGIKSSVSICRGHVIREIVNQVRPGDLVVMTTHGKGRAPRWFLGRVAEEVKRKAPVPVELVSAAELRIEDIVLPGHESTHSLGVA